MRILIASCLFSPSVGGVETVVALLAEEFQKNGHEVRVATFTAGPKEARTYQVVRMRNMFEIYSHVRWSDIVVQPNLSLKLFWPTLIFQRPTYITHQQWYHSANGRDRLLDKFKRFLCRFVKNITISQAMQDHLGQPSKIISNPYDSSTFFEDKQVKRQASIVCVSRLVSDKGVDVLLRALKILENEAPICSVVGEGPELVKLKSLVADSSLQDKVIFLGTLRGEDLRNELNRHVLMIVPSRNPEPFGIVALEGIACGCVVIGTEDGGLKEAIGPCGVTVPNNNEQALADAIKTLLNNRAAQDAYRSKADLHLKRHTAENVASSYLEIIESGAR